MRSDVSISDAEWQVMEAVWSLEGGTAAAIIEELAESTTWNHRTIRTLLRRLVDKGVLKQVRRKSGSFYQPVVPRKARVRKEGLTFLKRVFLGDTKSLLLHFAREAQLGPEKLEKLRELLHEDSTEESS